MIMEAAIHAFFVANPVTKGIIIGFISAVGIDLHAYFTAEATATFNLKKAVARWVYGGLVGAGIGAA